MRTSWTILAGLILMSASALAETEQTWHQVVATRFGDRDVMEWQSVVGLPQPGPGEVRIRVLAASASFTDVIVRKGLYNEISEKAPLVPGYDLVGIVDALGDGVNEFRIGQRVADLTVWGAYTEYAIRPTTYLVPVPDSVDPVDAVSLILSYTTAYQMLHRQVQLKAGQSVLVHGASGAVGTALTQLARLERLRVFGTASAGKRDYVQAQGAEPIDYRNEDFVQVIAARTGGAGVDAAFDAIGLDNFRRSYQALGDGGSLITYGLYRATLDAEPEKLWHVASEFFAFQWQKMMWRWFGSANKTVSFYSITDVREKHPDWFREDLASLFQLLAEGRISPRVWKVLPLSEAAQAHRMIEEGEVEGKIVLTTAGHRTR